MFIFRKIEIQNLLRVIMGTYEWGRIKSEISTNKWKVTF